MTRGFFIGIFVFIFLIWIATGGPTHPIAFTGVQLPEPGALGGGTYLNLPQASATVGGTDVCLPGSTSCPNSFSYGSSGGSGGSSGTTETINPLPAAPEGVTYSPPSPYRNEVSMEDYVSNASSSNPDDEYVQISVAQDAGGPIDITKWSLESGATYDGGVIPRGTITPTSGVVNPTQDIVLYPGDSAYIITGPVTYWGLFPYKQMYRISG
jgi:hypothetical protein